MDRFDWLEFERLASSPKEENVPRAMPEDASSFYRTARAMREAGHFKAAATMYRSAIGFNDQNFDAWVELIDTLVRAKHLDEAEALCVEARRNYGQVRRLYASYALVFSHRGRPADAIMQSDVSIENGVDWYSRHIRGEILLHIGKVHRFESIKWFEAAIDSAAHSWEPCLLAGWALLDAGLPVLAAGFFADAAHLHPRAPLCWLCLGDCFRELRLYDQALFHYQRVIELSPTHELALERQKACGGLIYGLMRSFNQQSMHQRWRKEYDRLLNQDEWEG